MGRREGEVAMARMEMVERGGGLEVNAEFQAGQMPPLHEKLRAASTVKAEGRLKAETAEAKWGLEGWDMEGV